MLYVPEAKNKEHLSVFCTILIYVNQKSNTSFNCESNLSDFFVKHMFGKNQG